MFWVFLVNSYKRLEIGRRLHRTEKNTGGRPFRQNEDQIANLSLLCNVLDSRVHAV